MTRALDNVNTKNWLTAGWTMADEMEARNKTNPAETEAAAGARARFDAEATELLKSGFVTSEQMRGTDAMLLAGSDGQSELLANNPIDDGVQWLMQQYSEHTSHPYRGKELATMEKDIPDKSWHDAYKAFPELQQLGEKKSTQTMKAIIANELHHYDFIDQKEDDVAEKSMGLIHGQSLGYAQITPDGVKDMAHKLDKQVAEGKRAENPLHQFSDMKMDDVVKALKNPANAPLFVAAHMAIDSQTLNNHKIEVTPLTLGYEYNADRVYAKSDKQHLHSLNKSEAKFKHIPFNDTLPTVQILQDSEHAHNIEHWFKNVE